ncbi:dihydrofolate reductase-like domain-containing protein [Terfezia claveryi]|nr:dihydrofolate reductase-like domain-containing protein [Terfezia claveryi]
MPPTTPYPQLTLIVAATTQLGIGLTGGLPWRLKAEMAYFARSTKRVHPPSSEESQVSNVVIMGRKTWASIFPKFRPLVDRVNIVITRDPQSFANSHPPSGSIWGPHAVASLDEGLQLLSSGKEGKVGMDVDRIFVIGGAEVYRLAFGHPGAKRVLLTQVRKLGDPEDGAGAGGEGGEGEGGRKDEFECDTFLQEFRGEGEGWRRMAHEDLCAFVGDDVPAGVQVEGGVGFEYQLWEKEGRI